MAKGQSQRTAPIITRSRAAALYSAASRLPAELVTEILEHLCLEDLWQAAAVSRAFYAAAKRARLYIHRNIKWGNFDCCDADLRTFREIVQHIVQHGLLLSFSFTTDLDDEWDPEKRSSCYEKLHPFLLELLSIVTTALPVLVFLELQVTDHSGPSIDDALRYPAPRLEELRLVRTPVYSPSTHTVPVDLFVGYAPKLREISLADVPLASEPVSAFALVEAAALNYVDVYPDIVFSRDFPRLQKLRLAFFTEDGKPAPHRFQLDGIALKKLAIDDGDDYPLVPSLERSLKLLDIPILEHVACDVDWKEPLWPVKNNDPLSVRLMHYQMLESDVTIHLVPEHRKWRRTFHLQPWFAGDACPLARMPGVSERLTYLRMDNHYLIGFLECDSLALDVLRELQVDFESEETRAEMLWPPDWLSTFVEEHVSFKESDASAPTFAKESYHYVHCRNLDTLTLFALDAVMSVNSQEAAFLGRALGQTSRRKKERAALVLMGVEFKKPVARTLLNQTYSAVHRYEFAGYDSFADYDDGLWDEDI